MIIRNIGSLFVIGLLLSSCAATKNGKTTDDGIIDIQYLQINDVYEIAPIEAGKVGGMARVATIKKELKAKNSNTYLIIAGDFLSPSVFNSLSYEGKRVRGRQMVDALNIAGLDIAGFGNHEFDISEGELQSRINESAFEWISSNSYHKTKENIVPFVKVQAKATNRLPTYLIKTYTDGDGTTAKIGIMAINIPFNKTSYVEYTDPLETAEKIYNSIKDSCDAIIAITHQDEKDDIILAKHLPGLAMIIGGHEHDMRFDKVGDVIVSKAHANARSVYVLNLQINKNSGTKKVSSRLQMLDNTVMLDSITNNTVIKWMNIANDNFSSLGFDPKKIILKNYEPLDARESSVRSGSTNFTKLVVKAIENAAPEAQVSIINSGSIRPDDILVPPLSQYDILRTLPFGGGIILTEMKGSLLKKILTVGIINKDSGGFLQFSEAITYHAASKEWKYKDAAIEDGSTYVVALTDFLLTGGESNLGFLIKTNPDIIKIYPTSTNKADLKNDIRNAVIQYMLQLNK